MFLKVKKSFKWAHRHVEVKEHNLGDVIDTEDEDLIRVATEEGWVSKVKEPKPSEGLKEEADPAGPAADPAAE